MRKTIRRVGLSALLLTSAGCVKMCAAEDVAMGVARLTTLNADALTNALDANKECGFANDMVKLNRVIEGNTGEIGTLTLTVEDCELDFGDEGEVTSKNCKDKETKAFGRATVVKAQKIVTGYLTGQMLNPVLPAGPDSVLITIDAEFDNFYAKKDGGAATMTLVSGGVSGNLRPRMAEGPSGNCSARTSNTAFDSVIYRESKAVLRSADREIEVDINSSELDGQYGKGPAGENVIKGKMKIWGEEHTLPPEGNEGLDDEYKADEFIEGFLCEQDGEVVFAEPLNYECGPTLIAPPDAAMAVARLTTLNAEALTHALNTNTTCGFSASTVLAAGVPEGTPGAPGGTFTLTVTDCEIDFGAAGTETSKNCKGVSTKGYGKVTVSGKRIVTGVLTGMTDPPILPAGPDAVEIELDAAFDNFYATKDGSDKSVVWVSGGISGNLRPRMAAGDTGNCSAMTPNTAFDSVSYLPTKAVLKSGAIEIPLDIDASALEGQAGKGPSGENVIKGTIKIGGTEHSLPVAGDAGGLDPGYDADTFVAGFSCSPDIAPPVSYECGPTVPQP